MAGKTRRSDEPRSGKSKLKRTADREAALRQGLAAIGSISEEIAARMEATVRELRPERYARSKAT